MAYEKVFSVLAVLCILCAVTVYVYTRDFSILFFCFLLGAMASGRYSNRLGRLRIIRSSHTAEEDKIEVAKKWMNEAFINEYDLLGYNIVGMDEATNSIDIYCNSTHPIGMFINIAVSQYIAGEPYLLHSIENTFFFNQGWNKVYLDIVNVEDPFDQFD